MEYLSVIGLEVHVELCTATKMFCGCAIDEGAEPNTRICPQCAGLPGAMPTVNAEAVRLGVLAGLALGCKINPESSFDRKHYFYPDLPKGYQITQYDKPLCEGGKLCFLSGGAEKELGITRIHLEEDAGKLIHTPDGTGIDLNRCGVPLIEIVTEPELSSPQEAGDAFRAIRELLVFAGVTRGRMNQGNLRCDLNVSVHREGAPLGTRCEIKNLNSFRFVEEAAGAEISRQISVLENGGEIHSMTMRYLPDRQITQPMRRKETPVDYRYQPEPDLLPLRLEEDWLRAVQESLPELPGARRKRYAGMGLGAEECRLLSSRREWAEAYDSACRHSAFPVELAKLFTGPVFNTQNRRMASVDDPIELPFAQERLGAVADLLGSGRINAATARTLCAELFECDFDPALRCEEEGLLLLCDPEQLQSIAEEAVAANPALAQQYREGKTKVFDVLVGKAMGLSRGRAQADALRTALAKTLEKQ